MNAAELIKFEEHVAQQFSSGHIPGPIHLCSLEQAEPLVEIFKEVKPGDWVLSTWRSHWHALLKGVPREEVMGEVLAGRSMMLHFPKHKFMTSAILGGMLPIACGLAAAGERVWCFLGDMAASTGHFADAYQYACRQNLQLLTFVIEDNGLSTNTPTKEAWGTGDEFLFKPLARSYTYKRTVPHYGAGSYAPF